MNQEKIIWLEGMRLDLSHDKIYQIWKAIGDHLLLESDLNIIDVCQYEVSTNLKKKSK